MFTHRQHARNRSAVIWVRLGSLQNFHGNCLPVLGILVEENERSDTGDAKGREERNFSTIRWKQQQREPSHLSLSLAISFPFLLYDLDPPVFSIISFSYAFPFLFTIILKPIVVTFPVLHLFFLLSVFNHSRLYSSSPYHILWTCNEISGGWYPENELLTC
jgi:hypothetical protein